MPKKAYRVFNEKFETDKSKISEKVRPQLMSTVIRPEMRNYFAMVQHRFNGLGQFSCWLWFINFSVFNNRSIRFSSAYPFLDRFCFRNQGIFVHLYPLVQQSCNCFFTCGVILCSCSCRNETKPCQCATPCQFSVRVFLNGRQDFFQIIGEFKACLLSWQKRLLFNEKIVCRCSSWALFFFPWS